MNTDLIQVRNEEILTTSVLVAENFERQHKNVLSKIESLISEIEGGLKISHGKLFEKSEYLHEQSGRYYPMYYMTRDGFTLLAMGFTGSKALEWKLKYIAAFNEMERRLRDATPQLPSIDDRLKIGRLIARTPYRNLPAVKELFPDYFNALPDPNSLEYICDRNTSYLRWIEVYGISKDWLMDFPTTEVYENYVRFCTENRFPSMGKKVFYHTLETDFGMTKKQSADGRRYFKVS